jgi:hypothetical protein
MTTEIEEASGFHNAQNALTNEISEMKKKKGVQYEWNLVSSRYLFSVADY